jgi:hypothetical protein
VRCIAVHHRQIAPIRKSSTYTRYITMAAPVPEAARRARSTHAAPERHAQGRVKAVMATAHTSPRTASGTPGTTDHELVVTSMQLTIPVSGQASAVGSLSWVTVR